MSNVPVIEISHLTKMYGKHRGVEDITFSVNEGEIFGFIGPNGAGKSTTIRTLLALIRPTSGSATIFGKDCIRYAPLIAKDVGYLPSEVFYYDNMRVSELLSYSASFYKKDCTQRMKLLSEAMELDLSRKVDDLSYGNKKKVGIVQGLLHEPKLIMLDEPTSGLDPLMQQTFFELLRGENRRGATVLFSSHILSEVQKLCGRVAIVKEGRIIKTETMSSLQGSSYKKCRLETSTPVEKGLFSGEGVTNFIQDGTVVSFLFKGDIGMVIRRAADVDLVDISIEEPSLEEIFLHYYA